MLRTRIVGAVGALALLGTPAVAVAHGSGHHHHKRHHHHQVKRDRDWTGTASATVQSFANGELTLALPSGKTYTADVTDRTVIICWTAPSSTTAKASHHGHDGDQGNKDDDATTTAPASTTTPPSTVPGDKHGRCGTDKLTTGAKVAVAKLSLIGDSVTWKKVVVVS